MHRVVMVLGVPRIPLAGTLLPVLAAGAPAGPGQPPGNPDDAFALALCSRAGIKEDARLRAALGGPLGDSLRRLAEAVPAGDWTRATALGRLTDAWVPLSSAHRPPAPPGAAALRAVALALADGDTGQGTDGREVLRTVAATVTLIENREKGTATAGEAIILALV